MRKRALGDVLSLSFLRCHLGSSILLNPNELQLHSDKSNPQKMAIVLSLEKCEVTWECLYRSSGENKMRSQDGLGISLANRRPCRHSMCVYCAASLAREVFIKVDGPCKSQ